MSLLVRAIRGQFGFVVAVERIVDDIYKVSRDGILLLFGQFANLGNRLL